MSRETGLRTDAVLGVWVIAVLLLVAALVVSGGGSQSDASGLSEAHAAMEISIADFEGGELRLQSFVGKPMVVSFFSSDCWTCLADLPELEQVHRQMSGEVTVVGLNVLEPAEYGLAVVEETGVTFAVARDPDGEVFRSFGAVYTPATVLIDADGQLVELLQGAVGADGLMERLSTMSSPQK